MVKKVAALIVIFIGCTIGWVILGSSVLYRTNFSDTNLVQRVKLLWGGEHAQNPPSATYVVKRTKEEETWENGVRRMKAVTYDEFVPIPLTRSDLEVKLFYEPRQKGLLWYSTYRVRFGAHYAFTNPSPEAQTVTVSFTFPSTDAQYDDFSLRGSNGDLSYTNAHGVISFAQELAPGGTVEFSVGYTSRGMTRWTYQFYPGPAGYGGGGGVTEVRNFRLAMETDFDEIDFPEGSMSPNTKAKKGGGWRLVWKYKRLVTGLTIGMLLPGKLNPGPLASRITFFAPVSLLFFLFILFIVSVLKKVDLHAMHYFFLSLSFFAFHLLFAYLVDHVEVHWAFIIAAFTSIVLVISYIRIVVGARFAFVETGLLQLLYLVLFSYSHFFKGYTGLIVTIFAVLTLFFIMQLTARVKWSEAFGGRSVAPVHDRQSPQ